MEATWGPRNAQPVFSRSRKDVSGLGMSPNLFRLAQSAGSVEVLLERQLNSAELRLWRSLIALWWQSPYDTTTHTCESRTALVYWLVQLSPGISQPRAMSVAVSSIRRHIRRHSVADQVLNRHFTGRQQLYRTSYSPGSDGGTIKWLSYEAPRAGISQLEDQSPSNHREYWTIESRRLVWLWLIYKGILSGPRRSCVVEVRQPLFETTSAWGRTRSGRVQALAEREWPNDTNSSRLIRRVNCSQCTDTFSSL